MHTDDSTPNLGRRSEPLLRKRQDEEDRRFNLTPGQNSIDTGFRDGIWCSRAPPVWTHSMRGHHPGYESHQHVADLLALWLPGLLAAAAARRRDPSPPRPRTSTREPAPP